MPLDFKKTKIELRKFMDNEYENFVDYPRSDEEAAEKWANAVNEGAKGVIPISLNSEIAKESFYTALLAAIKSKTVLTLFPSIFQIYAVQLAAGMTTPDKTGNPPPVAIVFMPVYILGFAGAKQIDCINAMIPIIDTWFKTGFVVNNSTGVTIIWQ